MPLKELLIPQDKIFFDLLTEQSKILMVGAEALYDMVMNYSDVHAKAANIKRIENQGDSVAHEIYVRLNRTFVTPLDREDLINLASKCDDVLDAMNGVARRLLIFEVGAPTENMKRFVELILKAARQISLLMSNIRKADQKLVDGTCEEVDSLENQGDELLHISLIDLFRENKDAVEIIKLKEVYEWFEITLDRCEDVTYVIADIVMKNR
jgi:predicted phosphate transport protein (TIGR00153 family)